MSGPGKGNSDGKGDKVYEAFLAHPESLAQVAAARRAIEQAGGRVRMAPPNARGMVLVTLMLPVPYAPEDFLPGMPFYLV